jgi:Ca2+-binding RTX toxin-like protein
MGRSHRLVPAVVYLQVYVTVMRETTTDSFYRRRGVAYGGRGNDYFSSTLGAGIWFYGQEGDDTLVGNDEQTNMAGGHGADTFVCSQEGEDIIVDYRPGQDGDVIENQVLR